MIYVYNNFCPQIDQVRESFMLSGFGTWKPNKGKVGSSIYEGMNFMGDHHWMMGALMSNLGKAIAPNRMFARLSTEEVEKAYVHSDRNAGSWTCVAYLSDHAEVSGTGFYRHRETGLLEMPIEWMDDKTRAKEMVEGSEEVWEQTDFVRGLYNRAVVFHAPLFHSRIPKGGIATTDKEGRMCWVCHFHVI